MERRLAAILAADVVGYSRLMAVDEAGTHDRLKALRREMIEPAIARHRGRVVKLMGDGALVEFASVVDAVECAAAIQVGVGRQQADVPDDRRILFRIGLNIGDILIEHDDIYGSGVNIAARLEGLAEPGGICISRNVYNQVKDKVAFGFTPMGAHRVKNIPEPVVAYRLLSDPRLLGQTTGLRRAWMRARRPAAVAALVLALLTGAGAMFGFYPGTPALAPSPAADDEEAQSLDPRRIAVLPFANMSADPDNAYFADGISEELISQLSTIGELSVIARTSTMKYKDSDKTIAEIGRELSVGTILEGSVRKAADQVRITAQLIDVRSETHLWTRTYDRVLESVFAIQSDIAEKVADNLKITLLSAQQERLERPDTRTINAYNLYLRAHYAFNQQSSESVIEAVRLLEEAVALDPAYAAAYAALADFLNALIWFSDIPPAEAHGRARSYAEKALALDPGLARAHAALGSALMYGELDWRGAELAYERALALNPSLARVHQHYGHFFLLAAQRRDDDGLAHVARALELDPLSEGVMNSLGWVRYHRREYDQAIAVFRKAQAMAPGDPWNYVGIGQSLIFLGDFERGLSEIEKALEVSPGYDFLLCYLGWAYGMTGRLDEARRVIERLDRAAASKAVSPMAFAWAYAGMGEKSRAIDWLEEAYRVRDGAVIMLRVPEFADVLSGEPRYHALVAKMGFKA